MRVAAITPPGTWALQLSNPRGLDGFNSQVPGALIVVGAAQALGYIAYSHTVWGFLFFQVSTMRKLVELTSLHGHGPLRAPRGGLRPRYHGLVSQVGSLDPVELVRANSLKLWTR
jgi:hypothetical protein